MVTISVVRRRILRNSAAFLPKYAAAAAYAGVESSELFQIFVPCTKFAILYIFVKSKFWQLIRTIFIVLDNRFMIIVSKTFSLK